MWSHYDDDEVLASVDSLGRIDGVSEMNLDFGFKSWGSILEDSGESGGLSLRELQQDCKYVDSELFSNAFWMPRKATPRCTLERLALEIFDLHTQSLPRSPHIHAQGKQDDNDKKKGSSSGEPEPPTGPIVWDITGVEWWVQHCVPQESGGSGSASSSSLKNEKSGGFHFEKDENIRSSDGVYVHAALSTVTYLSPGVPTVILEKTISTDGQISKGDIQKGFVSFPRVGKHIVFDARYLHGMPAELGVVSSKKRKLDDVSAHAEGGSNKITNSNSINNKKQKLVDAAHAQDTKEKEGKRSSLPESTSGESGAAAASKTAAVEGKGARVTFLANIWINHRPFGVNRLPEVASKLLTNVKIPSVPYNKASSIGKLKATGDDQTFNFHFGPSGDEFKLQIAIPTQIHQLQSKHDSVELEFGAKAAKLSVKKKREEGHDDASSDS
eukprot:CAMPEP_0197518012 /NCGR_PEP_ID=MMETSP1318-20131121/3114_1 /TAXON_ID=552666 /ORGANISM="Partenskyella glossopodia, Strain RCC365" /LENGTH=440 /DNA_ID=CAMNT_0043068023 /DNA_START=411 /DNA_END=1733 /DNA_ORIENTATION=+